jgi:acyl transferase domain-containing protein
MDNEYEGAVAIIGMAGRFPGAESTEELWQNLCQGEVSMRAFGRD